MRLSHLLTALTFGLVLTFTPALAQKPQIEWLTIEGAVNAPDGQVVYTRGRIISVMEPRPDSAQPYSVYVADSTGQVRVIIFQNIWEEMPDTTFIRPGTSLDLYGVAGQYRGIEQIEIQKPNHLRQSPGTATLHDPMASTENQYFRVDIGVLNMTTIGRKVRLQGIVTEYQTPPRERWPHSIILEDHSGSIQIVYWDDVADGIAPEHRPQVGQPLEIRGIVGEYRGVLQLRVDSSEQVNRQFEYKGRPLIAESNPDSAAAIIR